MAEIVAQNEKDLSPPQGDFKEWTENKSDKGQVYFTRDVDKAGKTAEAPKEESAHDVKSHGPSFDNVACYWAKNTEGSTSTDFANRTGITWYKLRNTVGATYQLTFSTNSTYDYYFHTPPDTYNVNVYFTSWTHEVTYTTWDPTVTSVSGS